jgi:hypothetical protein
MYGLLAELSFDRCQELKAAGLPQGHSLMVYMPGFPECVLRTAACQHGYSMNSPELLDCPNSDELLSDIQNRWEGIRVDVSQSGDERYKAHAHYRSHAMRIEGAPHGESMPAALTNLYCMKAAQ